jgi:hypothetical protein
MTRRAKIVAVLGLGLVLGAVLLAPFAWRLFEVWAVGIHQRGVTSELAAWEQEYSRIENEEQAFRAIGMLEYVQRYYTLSPGYRSDPDTEAALERQRRKAVTAIVEALERFTGEAYGNDVAEWEAWRNRRQRR